MAQGGDHGEHPLLLRPSEVGLEAHQVIDGAHRVVPPQLDHGEGLLPGLGVPEAPGLQGAVAQGLLPPPGHHLHRHAPFKDILILKPVDRGLLGGAEFPPEGQVLLLGQGAVDVIRRALVVPGGKPGAVHVDALEGHQGGSGIVEV